MSQSDKNNPASISNANNSGTTLDSPFLNRGQLESPGAKYRKSSTLVFNETVALFTNTIGYVPNFDGLNASRADLAAMMKRSIFHANLEKRVNVLVMIVIIVDTIFMVFETDHVTNYISLWLGILNWVFLSVYAGELGFRLYISTPTSAFFRKRFYVLDLIIVVGYLVLQIASTMSYFASAIRAIRLVRLFRIIWFLKFLRFCTRIFEIWHEYNKEKAETVEGTSLHINLRVKIDNFRLQKLLSRNKLSETMKVVKQGQLKQSTNEKELDIQELYKIVKLLKDEEDKYDFRWVEFSMEWFMLLTLWLAILIALSWAFLALEFNNYESVIEQNLELKELIDNSLPVREWMPDILSTLTSIDGDTINDAYYSLNNVYQEYTNANKTLWNDLESMHGNYMFSNPWTLAGSSFFTISILTTIGYGSFTPMTKSGQLVVLFCSLPAIYVTLLFGRKNIWMFKAGLCRTHYESVGMIIFFSVVLLAIFMVGAGWIMSESEGWTLMESIYFCWVSSSTIGFGDYVPAVGEEWNITYLLLVLVGWHVIAFVISVIEVTIEAIGQWEWWNEYYLWPSGSKNSHIVNSNSAKLTPSFYGVAQVIKETDGSPSSPKGEASLLMTPVRKKPTFTKTWSD